MVNFCWLTVFIVDHACCYFWNWSIVNFCIIIANWQRLFEKAVRISISNFILLGCIIVFSNTTTFTRQTIKFISLSWQMINWRKYHFYKRSALNLVFSFTHLKRGIDIIRITFLKLKLNNQLIIISIQPILYYVLYIYFIVNVLGTDSVLDLKAGKKKMQFQFKINFYWQIYVCILLTKIFLCIMKVFHCWFRDRLVWLWCTLGQNTIEF